MCLYQSFAYDMRQTPSRQLEIAATASRTNSLPQRKGHHRRYRDTRERGYQAPHYISTMEILQLLTALPHEAINARRAPTLQTRRDSWGHTNDQKGQVGVRGQGMDQVDDRDRIDFRCERLVDERLNHT